MAGDIPGRECKLTPELQQQLIECIEAGLYYSIACDAVGIDVSTFNRWYREGRANLDEKKKAFYLAIKKAKASCAKGALQAIEAHRDKEWTASAWLLERRFRKYYGKDAKDLREVARLIKLLSKGEHEDGEANNSKKEENPKE